MESPLVLDGGVGHSVIFTNTRAALKPTAELLSDMEPLLGSVVRAIRNEPNS